MNSCFECKNLIKYSGSKDRYGVPQEPDDYECKACENLTEEEFDKFFCEGEEWDEPENGCSGFEQADWRDYED